MAEPPARSPKITHISWGRMEVEGLGEGKDFKLYPAGGRAWDWSETGTRHVPGIQPADVLELLEHGSEVIVLSRGMDLVLQTCPETLELLKARGVRVHVEETCAAVALYNKLAEDHSVGGLFHSTAEHACMANEPSPIDESAIIRLPARPTDEGILGGVSRWLDLPLATSPHYSPGA